MNTIKLVIDKSGIFKKVDQKVRSIMLRNALGIDVFMHVTNFYNIRQYETGNHFRFNNYTVGNTCTFCYHNINNFTLT
jgi:hypothetical protein